MNTEKKQQLSNIAAKIRLGVIESTHAAGAGHPGGSLSIADILAYLYFEEMNVNVNDPKDANVYDIKDEFTLGDTLLVAPILAKQTFEREVYLPKGSWTNLLTGERLTGDRRLTVKASMAQIPLFLNNDSKDAESLATVFAGKTWTDILAL